MGIVRTVEWSLVCPASEAVDQICSAMTELSLDPKLAEGVIHGQSKRAMLKNRWAAKLTARVAPAGAGSAVTWQIDMAGTMHYTIVNEIAQKMGDALFDDQGLTAAVDRLGSYRRLIGKSTTARLRNLLYASERVVELGQGVHRGSHRFIVLTSERLFFLDKELGKQTIEEFALSSINSLSMTKKRGVGGEQLVVHVPGNQAEVSHLGHGQGDALVRAFRELKQGSTAAIAKTPVDVLAQIEKLAELHSKGILSADEFETKKTDLLNRL